MPVTNLQRVKVLHKFSANLLYFSFVPLILSFYFPYFSFIMLLIFFINLDKKPVKSAFFTFLPYIFFIYSGVFLSMYRFYGLNFFIALLLYSILVFYHFLYLFMPVYLYKKIRFNILLLPFVFVTFEYLKDNFLFGLPLGDFSIFVYNIPFFIKDAAIFGQYFISLKLIFINLSFYLILKGEKIKVALIFVAVLICFIIPYEKPQSVLKNKTISVVQANIPQNEKWSNIYLSRNLKRYISMSKGLKSDVIIWPESSYPYLFSQDRDEEFIKFLKDSRFNIIFGAVRKENQAYFNSAVFFKKGKFEYYNKRNLVPFAEFIPLRTIISDIMPSSIDPGDFKKGETGRIFRLDDLKIAPLICYEENFMKLSRDYKDRGANILTVLTNDAWFDKSPTFYMFPRSDVFMAVENRIWVIRVANTGISEIVNPYGKIVSHIEPDTREVMTKTLNITVFKRTLFDRYGYLFPFLVVFISLFILL